MVRKTFQSSRSSRARGSMLRLLATLILTLLTTLANACEHCQQRECNEIGCATCSQCMCHAKPFDRYKNSFVQLWESEATWIGTNSDFQFNEINTLLRLAVPLDGTMDNILALQPALRTYHLNGPTVVDVPEQLYDAQLNILWRKQCTEKIQTSIWMQPKIRSDMETSHDAFFFSGGFFAKYEWSKKFDLYLGALYLDRDDISFLPGFGFIWKPNHNVRLEALLPRPKFSYRIRRSCDQEVWAYLSGQLGGGSFAVQRTSGAEDKVTIHDLRMFVGLETVRPGGAGLFCETGWVFNRGIEYHNDNSDYSFGDSLMLRAGVRF